jgi:hypothetical protein
MEGFSECGSSRGDQGSGYNREMGTRRRDEQDKQGVKKAHVAGVHMALAGGSQVTPPAGPRRGASLQTWQGALAHTPMAMQGFWVQGTGTEEKDHQGQKVVPVSSAQ